MKRFLLILLTLSLLLTVIPSPVSAVGNPLDALFDSIPWDEVNNYIDYDNEDGHKTEGYRPGKITVFMTEEFMSTHEVPVPSDFVDSKNNIYFDENIIDIIHKEYYDYNEFDIIMDWFQEPYTSSIEKTIQGYIYTLQDLEFLKIVERVRPYYVYAYGSQYSEVTDLRNYDEYYYYKNEDRHKESGYSTDCIIFNATDDFKEYVEQNYEVNEYGKYILDKSVFPEIQDKIISVELGVIGWGTVYLEKHDEKITDYTKDHIDAFVEILKYLCDNPLVVSLQPNLITTFIVPIPTDPPESETDDTTVDTEEETTEEEETTLPETTAPETTSNDTEKASQKNHQTGDGLYFLMAAGVLSFALFSFVTALKKRVKSK